MATADLFEIHGATFSPCRTWRYALRRFFARSPLRLLNFLMLNPSTADEDTNDPTVERCERFARRWGYDGLIVTNLFGYRATNPDDMKAAPDPIGPWNDIAITEAAEDCARTVVAWGNHGGFRGRSEHVCSLLRHVPLYCLGTNRTGEPVHPLYQPSDAQLFPYDRETSCP